MHPGKLIARLRASDIARHGALVLVATTLGNALSFVYHAVVSRRIGVTEYGALAALISFALLATFPTAFMPTVIARYAAQFRAVGDADHLRALQRFVVRIIVVLAVIYIALFAMLAWPIGAYLHVSPWIIPVGGVIAAAAILAGALRAILQGEQDFVGFSASSAAEGTGKAAIGAGLTLFGFGLPGALAGFAFGSIAGVAIAYARFAHGLRGAAHVALQFDWRRIWQTSGGSLAVAVATVIFTTADVILVKHFFSGHEAGLYAAASLGGKIMLYVVGFAPAVLLPKATAKSSRGESSRSVLLGTFAMLGVVIGVGLLAFHFGSLLLVHALFGRAFDAAAPLLVWYALAMSLLACTTVVASYALAVHRLSFAVPLVLVALGEVAAILLYHPSAQAVVGVVVAVNAAALLVSCASLGWDSRRRRVDSR